MDSSRKPFQGKQSQRMFDKKSRQSESTNVANSLNTGTQYLSPQSNIGSNVDQYN